MWSSSESCCPVRSGGCSLSGLVSTSLRAEEGVRLLDVGVIVVLLEGSEAGAAVVLGAAAALLVAEVLASVGREESW